MYDIIGKQIPRFSRIWWTHLSWITHSRLLRSESCKIALRSTLSLRRNLGVARRRIGAYYGTELVGPEGGERKGLRGEFHGYRVGRGKLMNGGDLVGVNKRAPGSGNRCTKGRPFPVLSRTPDRGTLREISEAQLDPRFSAFQRYHVTSARQDTPNECFKPFELRRMAAQSVTLSSARKQYRCIWTIAYYERCNEQ